MQSLVKLIAFRAGPLISTWCMRMEGKNSYFKRVAQCSNFKNVPYTVARRHQRLLCAYLQSHQFFNISKDYGPSNIIEVIIVVNPVT